MKMIESQFEVLSIPTPYEEKLLGLFAVRLLPEESQLFFHGVNLKKRAVDGCSVLNTSQPKGMAKYRGGYGSDLLRSVRLASNNTEELAMSIIYFQRILDLGHALPGCPKQKRPINVIVIEAGRVNNTWRVKTVEDIFARVIHNLIARLSGPMKFRLIIQPLMATVFAVLGGLKDAREKRPPFFRGFFSHPAERSDMLRDGWKSVGKIFILAVILDLVEQVFFYRSFYPGEALLVAFVLAFIPYLLIRGPVNRVARRKQRIAAEDKRL